VSRISVVFDWMFSYLNLSLSENEIEFYGGEVGWFIGEVYASKRDVVCPQRGEGEEKEQTEKKADTFSQGI